MVHSLTHNFGHVGGDDPKEPFPVVEFADRFDILGLFDLYSQDPTSPILLFSIESFSLISSLDAEIILDNLNKLNLNNNLKGEIREYLDVRSHSMRE